MEGRGSKITPEVVIRLYRELTELGSTMRTAARNVGISLSAAKAVKSFKYPKLSLDAKMAWRQTFGKSQL